MSDAPTENADAAATALPDDLVFEGIRYSRVWEDHQVLTDGLQVRPDDDVLSICSAGDNVLALILAGANSVTAVDLNASQTAMLHLQIAAVRTLDHAGYARLMGALPGDDRSELYARVRDGLPAPAQRFWDASAELIEAGIVNCGRLDLYFLLFQHGHLFKFVPRDTIETLFGFDDLAAQADYFRTHVATPELQECIEWYFGREMMEKSGRDPAQFAFVDVDDVGPHFWRRFVHACVDRPLRRNFYTRLLLTASYGDLAYGPPHLRPQNFETLRARVDRIRIVEGDIGSVVRDHPQDAFSAANLSDIFEYLPEDTTEALVRQMAERFRPGGRLAWWCLLVPRPVPSAVVADGLVADHHDTAQRLWADDRCWFYRSFELAEVTR